MAGVNDITLRLPRAWYKETTHLRPPTLTITSTSTLPITVTDNQPVTTCKMLSRTILVALVSAACFATVNAQTCSAANTECCQQLQDSDNLDANALNLLRLLNVDPNTLTGSVGLSCTSIVSGSCDADAACCIDIRTESLFLAAPSSSCSRRLRNVLASAEARCLKRWIDGVILRSLRISYG
jgi:hypothetical protein